MLRFGYAALAGVLAELAALGLIVAAAWLITRAAEQPPVAALGVAIVAVRACALGKGVFRYMERLIGHDVALRAQARARGRLFRALVPPRSAFPQSANLLSRMVDDTDAVQDLLVRCLLPAVAALVTGLAAVGVVGSLFAPAAMVVLAGLLIAGVGLPAITYGITRRGAAKLAPAKAALAERTADLVRGSLDLAAYGATGDFEARAMAADSRLGVLERRQASLHGALFALGVLIQGSVVTGVVVMAEPAVGTVPLVVLALTALVALESVLPLTTAGQRLSEIRAALRRLEDLTTEPTPESPARPLCEPVTVEVVDLVVRHGRRTALDGVNLTLSPGKRVALIGPSGAGKSTLLAALMRLVEPDSGTIKINGRVFDPDTVREVMTGLTQDAYVFQATLRDNLRLARPDAGDAELRAALEAARLPALDLDLWLGEDGRTLSGGQIQRLALARALLRDPPVLLLDEPTESLDEPTADALVTDLLDATRGRTTVLVTHRLHRLNQVDEIIVLDEGQVTQRGRHEDLVRQPGYYRDHWEAETMLQLIDPR